MQAGPNDRRSFGQPQRLPSPTPAFRQHFDRPALTETHVTLVQRPHCGYKTNLFASSLPSRAPLPDLLHARQDGKRCSWELLCHWMEILVTDLTQYSRTLEQG